MRVTLPLSRNGILAGLALIMLPMFGDYYTPELMSGAPNTRMMGNEIQLFIQSGVGEARGAALTVVLMTLVAILMLYYIISVSRSQRAAQR